MASGNQHPIARSVSGISMYSAPAVAEDEGAKPSQKDASSKVNVIVRLRPPASPDEDISEVFALTEKKSVTVKDPLSRGRMEHNFTFDHVFAPEDGQEAVFDVVAKPLVDNLLNGFNSCCFAYGQTGSGKTHSVFGEGNKEQRGLLARSIEYLFDRIEGQAEQKEVGMVVSFLEIYLDQVRDLGRFYLEGETLVDDDPVSKTPSMSRMRSSQSGKSLGSRPGSAKDKDSGSRPASGSRPTSGEARSRPPSGKAAADRSRTSGAMSNPDELEDLYVRQDLPIHETPQGLVFVEDLSLIPVTNIREVLGVANLGVQMRATFETKLNARSSRSHTIFSVSIVQKSKSDPKSGVVGSVVNFVDLAGSERLARSQSEGRRFQEAVIINSSLSALGKVVLALASDKARHIPYRDSKLTRILQNSLGGNSYTTLLTTVDPSAANYEESLNSLFFADRCQNVQNKPIQNVAKADAEGNERQISKLTLEIVNLKHQLEVAGAAQGPGAPGGNPGAGRAPVGVSGVKSIRSQRSMRSGVGQMSMAGSMMSQQPSEQLDLGDVLDQAGEKLMSERKLAFQLEVKVQLAEDQLDRARIEQLHRDDKKRKEAGMVKNSIKALKMEMQKCQQRSDYLQALFESDQVKLTTSVHRKSLELKNRRMDLASTFARPILESALVGEDGVEMAAQKAIDEKCATLEKEFDSFTKALERSHARESFQLTTPFQQWFQEKDAESELAAAGKARCISDSRQKRNKIQGELISAWDLAQRLFKIVEAQNAGVPNEDRCKVHRVDPSMPVVTMPLVGSRPSSRRSSKNTAGEGSKEESSPRTLAGKIASLLVGLPDPPLRSDAKDIREQLCKTPVQPSGPDTLQPCRPSAPTARPASAGFTRSRASSETAGSATATSISGEDVSWWDADGFARDFCDLDVAPRDESGAHEVLQSLCPARLRALCTSLHRRVSLSKAEKAAETAKALDEVARRLSHSETVERIREMEREIAKYKEQQAVQHEEQYNLDCVLKHCNES